MKQFQVSSEFTITRTVGIFEAQTEEEAIKKARSKLLDMSIDFGCDGEGNTWAEEVESRCGTCGKLLSEDDYLYCGECVVEVRKFNPR